MRDVPTLDPAGHCRSSLTEQGHGGNLEKHFTPMLGLKIFSARVAFGTLGSGTMGLRHTDLFALLYHFKDKQCFITATCFNAHILELYLRFQLSRRAIDEL